MFYKIQNKELDLLAAYERKEGPSKISKILKMVGIPIGLVLIFTISFLFLFLGNKSIENQINDMNASNEEVQLKIDAIDKEPYYELSSLEGTYASLQTIDNYLSGLPHITAEKILTLKQSLLSGMSMHTLSYDQTNKVINASFSSSNVQNIEKYVSVLKTKTYYSNIVYTGYQQSSQSTTQGTGQIDELTGQEITTNEVVVSYNFNLVVTLEGGE